jgi:hypothetical protein
MSVFIDIWFVKQNIQTKICSFLWRIWKWTEKGQIFFYFPERGFEPQIFSNFPVPWFEFSWKVRVTRSNQNKLLKEIGLYYKVWNSNKKVLMYIRCFRLLYQNRQSSLICSLFNKMPYCVSWLKGAWNSFFVRF